MGVGGLVGNDVYSINETKPLLFTKASNETPSIFPSTGFENEQVAANLGSHAKH